MPSLIDLRRRIRSVQSTQQVTKAMKLVSAAKLRRAQDRVLAARPYAAMFRAVLADVAAAVAADERLGSHPLLARRSEQRILLVLITADRGLAGAFNTNLIKAAQAFLAGHAGAAIELMTLGRKGRDFFRKRQVVMAGERLGLTKQVQYADAAAIAGELAGKFERAEVDAVYLLYNEFKSIMAQRLVVSRVLPIEVPTDARRLNYIYEQPPEKLMAALLPRYVEIAVYHALLESAAAEHGARMTAMDAATSNAGEMIEKLTIYMNRVRQASITKEIIEVVSGAAGQE